MSKSLIANFTSILLGSSNREDSFDLFLYFLRLSQNAQSVQQKGIFTKENRNILALINDLKNPREISSLREFGKIMGAYNSNNKLEWLESRVVDIVFEKLGENNSHISSIY